MTEEKSNGAVEDRRSGVRRKSEESFEAARACMSGADAHARVATALRRFETDDAVQAQARLAQCLEAFPDQADPDGYWVGESDKSFRDFFVWGHDQHFGAGHTRSGAMGPRHVEIATESLRFGLLPADLTGRRVLDVGCWSGGDVLLLTGLGGEVTAIEEHPKSADSARFLLDLVDCPGQIVYDSLYRDRPDWQQSYDFLYVSGVIYHVTDPLLFLRIAFAYLKPGGSILLETKASRREGSACDYAGTAERGWNWYGPSWEALGRWLLDAGFDGASIRLHRRGNGRLLAAATKREARPLPETAGFSRPGSWLEGCV